MIIFKKLSWRNFLSTGDTAIEVILNKTPATLIVGSNGAGKSTLLDALSFALFGKPHRNITKPQLLNSINQKNCVVTADFAIGNVEFRIVRGIKPNIFEIWQNGVMLNQESHSRDYQKLLESNILKLNHKSFHQIVVLGSNNFTPFMQLGQWTRREVIEDLLDIGIFTKMNVLLKERQGKMKDSILELENLLNITQEKISLQNKHLDELKRIDRINSLKMQNEIATLEVEISDRNRSIKQLQGKYDLEYAPAVADLRKEKVKHTQLASYGTQIKSNLDRMNKEVTFYSGHSVCPTCQQAIDDDFKHTRTEACGLQIAALSDGYTRLQSNASEVQNSVHMAELKLAEMVNLNNDINSNLNYIRALQGRISALLISASAAQNSSATASMTLGSGTKLAEANLKTLEDELGKLLNRKSEQLEERTYNLVVEELLKDTGIKTKVIRQYLPMINKYVNNYLGVLDFFVSFTLDESFEEIIKSRHRDEFCYNSFSEGEKQRIDLALIFTWRQIAKMKNSTNTNLLILDETFDSSMDIAGVDNLLKILNTLKNEQTNIFVISHKADLLDDKFPAKLEFQRANNFSKMIEH